MPDRQLQQRSETSSYREISFEAYTASLIAHVDENGRLGHRAIGAENDDTSRPLSSAGQRTLGNIDINDAMFRRHIAKPFLLVAGDRPMPTH